MCALSQIDLSQSSASWGEVRTLTRNSQIMIDLGIPVGKQEVGVNTSSCVRP